MPLNSERAFGPVTIRIDAERCRVCGTCARVCPSEVLVLRDGRLFADGKQGLGCIACGHCMCVCPHQAIAVSGRDLLPEDSMEVSAERADYERLQSLLLARRSVRRFREEAVSDEDLTRILDAAASAPMGFPPSHVGVLVAHGRAEVQAFRRDLMPPIRGMRRFMGAMKPLLGLMMGSEAAEGFKRFVLPVAAAYEKADAQGKDVVFYDAPLALYFYGRPLADPADPVIAASLAMIAAEALGLGTCLLGFPGPVLQRDSRLRKKYGLPEKVQPGVCVAVGHPAVKYRRAVRRRFVEVRHVRRGHE
jgi:nitroreductase/NAD-dependent dihydropyrimidine dehydrogenase PreA subunit